MLIEIEKEIHKSLKNLCDNLVKWNFPGLDPSTDEQVPFGTKEWVILQE